MKNIFVILFSAPFFFSLAGDEIDEVRPYLAPYAVISDTFDAKVPKGKCLIEGTIYDFSSGEKLQNVSVMYGSKVKSSDKMGYFRVVPTVSVTHLKFSKMSYKESFMEEYAFKSQHRIIVRIYMKSELEEIHYEVKKPVIYCYSNREMHFDFSLKAKGDLLFNYPAFSSDGNWKMHLKENLLYDAHGNKTYPYLFWESRQQNLNFKQTEEGKMFGDCVQKKEMVNYLDSVLNVLGFNSREKTDFITFWAPQMQQFNYYAVQFLVNEECEQFAAYEIHPGPDAVNRVYMLFSGQNSYLEQKEKQILKPMKREGFYIVDWGGIDLTQQRTLNAD